MPICICMYTCIYIYLSRWIQTYVWIDVDIYPSRWIDKDININICKEERTREEKKEREEKERVKKEGGKKKEREETDFYEEGILQDLRTTSFAFIPVAS